MKKNLSSILQKGNIKPSDRVRLLVADMASKERDGKALLTEADKHALSEGWTPKNNREAEEYNRFNEGWKNVAYAEMDAQTTYLQATNGFLRASKYLSIILFKSYTARKDKTLKEKIGDEIVEKFLKENDFYVETKGGETTVYKNKAGEALKLVLGYLGFELDDLIHSYAYELASDNLKKDLLALYPDAKTDGRYLEQEEIIFDLFKSKDKLTQGAKEELAELITDKCRHLGIWGFDGYFADIPLVEVLTKWGRDNDTMTKNQKDLTKHLKDSRDYKNAEEELADLPNAFIKDLTPKLNTYAKEHKREVQDIIKETVLKWLNNGLLDTYTPLFKSNEKATCNEQKTKLTHKEVFKEWLKVKTKAREKIQELIDNGELKTKTETEELHTLKPLVAKLAKELGQDLPDTPITKTKTLITGESLYNLKGDYQFIKDFKEQAEDFKIFGALVLFLRTCRFVRDYSTLLAFELLFKELSKTFETDLTYSIKKWMDSFYEDLKHLKMEFLMLADEITGAGYKADRVYYLSENFLEELLNTPFDPAKVKPDIEGKVSIYASKIKDILQDDFNNPFVYGK